MDGYQFIADLFKSAVSLAWPIMIFAIVYIFKEPLIKLLPYLDISYKDFKLSLRQAEQKAEALPEQKAPAQKLEESEFDKLLKVSPAAAVVQMRRELEASLMAYAEKRGMVRIPLGLHRLSRELLSHELIDQTTAEVLTDLAQTAAAASHSSSEMISESDAIRFRDVAERVIGGLNFLAAAAAMPPPGPIPQG